LLKAVANRRRLRILCELSRSERSLSELGEAIGFSQSALRQHIARLRARVWS
jgi:DNA-binding transcriptional ArsR family regulator